MNQQPEEFKASVYYCQWEIENEDNKCESQCEHCKTYYRPLENSTPVSKQQASVDVLEGGNKAIHHFMGERELAHIYDYRVNCFYHSSWDWLMPVMGKIESLEFDKRRPWTNIKTFLTTETYYECIIKIWDKEGKNYLYELEAQWSDKKIDAVYNSVIEFIKWYNTQTKKQ